MIAVLLWTMLLCALVPAVMFCVNLRLYRAPEVVGAGVELPAVSILIPARDEAAVIERAVRAALETRGVAFEVVVMDDGSSDGTDAIVLGLAAEDARVRLERAPALPAGWNGKQHACWALAHAARMPVLCFVDADVTLRPECVGRMCGLLESSGSALVSGFPRQVTETWMEWMLLPLIHFVLLGFLPIARMRKGTDPAFAAGCGQFLMVRREAYFACGGHGEIRATMHDGLRLPKVFRAAGMRTELADITELASCRMYSSAGQVWSGLAKNATEGIASPGRIVPISLVLLVGQVLPFVYVAYFAFWTVAVLLGHGLFLGGLPIRELLELAPVAYSQSTALIVVLATGFAYLPRVLAVQRFRQDWRGALLHPFGILLLLGVQWYALLRKVRGGAVSWRGRAYVGADSEKGMDLEL